LLTKKTLTVIGDVVNNIILYTPFDEIQLSQRRLDFMRCTWHYVGKLLRSTEWIKELFTIAIKA